MISKEERDRLEDELVDNVDDWEIQDIIDYVKEDRRMWIEELQEEELISEYRDYIDENYNPLPLFNKQK